MYQLSATLTGHASDVRALAAHCARDGTQILLSGSRDGTACVWARRSDGTFDRAALDPCGGFVNAVAWFDDGEHCMYGSPTTLTQCTP